MVNSLEVSIRDLVEASSLTLHLRWPTSLDTYCAAHGKSPSANSSPLMQCQYVNSLKIRGVVEQLSDQACYTKRRRDRKTKNKSQTSTRLKLSKSSSRLRLKEITSSCWDSKQIKRWKWIALAPSSSWLAQIVLSTTSYRSTSRKS